MEIAQFLVAEPAWCEERAPGEPPRRDGAGRFERGREMKRPRPKEQPASKTTDHSDLRSTVGKLTVDASEAIDNNLRLFRTACLGVMALSGAYIIYKSSAVREQRDDSIADGPALRGGNVPGSDPQGSIPSLCAPTAGEPRHKHHRTLSRGVFGEAASTVPRGSAPLAARPSTAVLAAWPCT